MSNQTAQTQTAASNTSSNTSNAMEKTYNPHAIEQQLYQRWEQSGYFAARGSGQPYCIMIPPPNVTGNLHMGHGFQNSLMDALIRYHRMSGHNTLWQIGTDHAGIATQMVVERELQREGKTRHDLGREQFVDRIWQWKEKSGNRITEQLRRLGSSVDWSRERFTMDQGLSKAVSNVFIKLHQEGLVYRGKRLVNWDPTFRTAISDLEVVNQEEAGKLWHIRYPFADDANKFLTIATTRPETMLGDVAVAVHPDDERYQDIIGKKLQLPLCDREIPIIADDYVDPEFGSGCVKITPAHDFNDNAIGQRHNLEQINILTVDAKINDNAPAAYQGLDRFAARKQIVADLQAAALLEKEQDHTLSVPRGDRSGDIIEPYLTDQWFVKMEGLAQPALEAVRNGEIKFVPENWTKTYYQWLENIEDWCISRQLWWGHRIPAWYDNDGNIYVAEDEAAVREKYNLAADLELQQDEDVLDTWFSSALWPFSTLGWPEQTEDLATYYPTSVLITGFDIIFFWVARMIMFGLKFTGKIPFKEVYITGLIRDSEGQKMSKSKGNVLDPIDLIDGIDLDSLLKKRTKHLLLSNLKEKITKATKKEFPDGIPAFGTDALRFTFCALASTGRDIRFDLGRIGGYRNFCNKLWNAARYVLMNCEGHVIDKNGFTENDLSVADRWIVSRMQHCIEDIHGYFDNYRFDLLAQTIYDFIWREYCDWYLELSKPVLYGDNYTAQQKAATRYTLISVLETLLRVLHPLMPFITEEIWQKVAPLAGLVDSDSKTIMLQNYPQYDASLINDDIELQIKWLQDIIVGIRTIRAEMNIAPSKPIPVLLAKGQQQDHEWLSNTQDLLVNLAKLESINWLNDGDTAPQAATALVGEMEVLIPLANLIDKASETARLQKEINKIQKDHDRSEGKLNNPNFVERAPADVIEKEKIKLAEIKTALRKLSAQLCQLEDI